MLVLQRCIKHVQACAQLFNLFRLCCLLDHEVAGIFALEFAELVVYGLLLALLAMHAALHLCVRHLEVVLIRVAERRLLLELFDGILLAVEVARAQDVVLLLLEEPEVLPARGLGPLAIRARLQEVAQVDRLGARRMVAGPRRRSVACFLPLSS